MSLISDRIKNKYSFLSHYGFLLSHWKLIILVPLASFISSILEGVGVSFIFPMLGEISSTNLSSIPFPLNEISTRLIQYPLPERLNIIALLLILIVIVKGGVQYFSVVVGQHLQAISTVHLRQLGFNQLSKMGMRYFNNHRKADFHTICYNYSENAGILPNHVILIIPQVMNIFVMLFMLFLLSWKMTLLSLLVASVSSYFIKNIPLKAKKAGEKFNEARKALNSSLLDMLSGMKVIRLFSNNEKELRDLNEKSFQFSSTQVKKTKINALVLPFYQLISTIGLSAILSASTIFLITSQNSGIELLIVFVVIFQRMSGPFQSLNKIRVGIYGDIPTYKEYFNFLKENKNSLILGKKKFDHLEKSICFDQVSFGYNSDTLFVVKNISFEILKGMKIGVVGESGSGKTTIIELLLRFYDPQIGNIIVDGNNLSVLDTTSWRKRIGVVSQDIFLFNDTIRGNITYANPKVSEAELHAAAKSSHAYEFIKNLPLGFDTVIGDRGILLSGGQQQRLAIARAILKKPDILVFDEATSALDSGSEKIVQNTLDEVSSGKTVISIAHRLSTIFDSDLILVMKEGELVEIGNHQELGRNGKVYKKLLFLQGYED